MNRDDTFLTGEDDPSPAEAGDPGFSLDDLSQAYAELLGRGHDPYQPIPEQPPSSPEDAAAADDQALLDEADEAIAADSDDGCEVSPRTIVEAMLFVGHPRNEPLSASQLAALMRGVRADEVEEIISELNAAYRSEHCPYQIVSEGGGFRMTLREEFRGLRDKFYGRVKEARLSQAAIDVLALVAYNQPVSREELDSLRDKDNGAILSQLVRRRLLRIDRPEDTPQTRLYRTTDRFLELFGLESTDDLPRTQDLER